MAYRARQASDRNHLTVYWFAMAAHTVDCYAILGIEKSAPQAEIVKSYRRLSLIHHPDKGGSTDKFILLQRAYDTLSDVDQRSQYDGLLEPWSEEERESETEAETESMSDAETSSKTISESMPQPAPKRMKMVGPSDYLYIGGLDVDICVSDLRYAFAVYGRIRSLIMLQLRSNNTLACLIRYKSQSEAKRAIDNLDGFKPQWNIFSPIVVRYKGLGPFEQNKDFGQCKGNKYRGTKKRKRAGRKVKECKQRAAGVHSFKNDNAKTFVA